MSSEEKHFYRLIDLVNATPNLGWKYTYLSENKNISLEDAEKNIATGSDNPFYPFSVSWLSNNPNINIKFVLKYINIGWNWVELSENIPISDILSYPNLPWDWNNLIASGKLTDLEFILKLPDSEWDWELLSLYLPANIIFTHPNEPWHYNQLSNNISVNMKIIKSHPEIKWDYDKLSSFINIKDIIANPDHEWNYDNLSENITLTAEYILQNINQPWNWDLLFNNKSVNFDVLADSDIDLTEYFPNNQQSLFALTSKFIVKYFNYFKTIFAESEWVAIYHEGIISINDVIAHPELIFSYFSFSNSTKLELWYVLDNLDQNWDWEELSRNSSFDVSDIIKGIKFGIKWYYDFLSLNPNLTFDFVYSNKGEEWDVETLSNNPYNGEYEKYKLVSRLEYNYLRQKRRKTKNVLTEYIINDLSKIVMEY